MPAFSKTERDHLTEDDITDAKTIVNAFFGAGSISDEQKKSVYYTQLSLAVPLDAPGHDSSVLRKEIRTICLNYLNDMIVGVSSNSKILLCLFQQTLFWSNSETRWFSFFLHCL